MGDTKNKTAGTDKVITLQVRGLTRDEQDPGCAILAHDTKTRSCLTAAIKTAIAVNQTAFKTKSCHASSIAVKLMNRIAA